MGRPYKPIYGNGAKTPVFCISVECKNLTYRAYHEAFVRCTIKPPYFIL
ncbi:hypothetical protein HMPREF1554_01909 [Porphyromonas gingivalis F0569]|nr:hypothetical protein HMPREF1554_01909 [Porphyromonas gingivalis F0569]